MSGEAIKFALWKLKLWTSRKCCLMLLVTAIYKILIESFFWKKELLRNDALFEEDYSHTLNRLNKFANSMKEVNPSNALERAAKVLTPELRQKSFMLDAQIGKATQEIRTKKILESLASKLKIEKETIMS